MRQSIVMDVSHLPEVLYGAKSTLWWGILALISIEGMVFALAIASYLYLRLQEAAWPPEGWARPGLLAGTANLALMAISVWPMRRIDVMSRRLDARAVKPLLILWLAIAAGMIVTRFFEYGQLHVKWDSNAYGSIVWGLLALHTLHLFSSFGETVALTAYFFTHELDAKHALDLHVNAVYWYFIVISWAVIYVTVYFGPVLLQ
jgi:cytochrome c oxidase subunit III